MGTEMNATCRLCDESNDQMLNIFNKNVMGIQIINVIKECLPLVIYRTDPLSKYICNSCNETLCMFYELKKTSVEIAKKNYEDLQSVNSNNSKVDLFLSIVNEPENVQSLNVEQITTENAETMTDPESTMEPLFTTLSQASLLQEENSLNSAPSYSAPINNGSISDSDMDIDDIVNESIIHEKNEKLIDKGDLEGTTDINEIVETTETIIEEQIEEPCRRFIGPKSKVKPYIKIKNVQIYTYTPFTLLECVVHALNKINVPTYNKVPYEIIEGVEELAYYLCSYCDDEFKREDELALHGIEHLEVVLEQVKTPVKVVENGWPRISAENAEESSDVDVENSSDNLLVPMEEAEPTLDISRNCRISLVNGVAHCNGKPLMQTPKTERYEMYQSVLFNGQRRKFCNLCRYTFKDNWNIDSHYLTSSCHYTCHYCGYRFVKNRSDINIHIKEHEERGDQKCTQVFVSNSKGGTLPKVCSSDLLKPFVYSDNPRWRNRIRNMQLRALLEQKEQKEDVKPFEMKPFEVKPLTTVDTATNQAYFCKKCYKVFAKLGEFNTHSANCKGEVTDPEMKVIRHYTKKDGSSPSFCSKVKQPPPSKSARYSAPANLPSTNLSSANLSSTNVSSTNVSSTRMSSTRTPLIPAIKIKKERDDEFSVSNTGRPLRHCVKEIGAYREEKMIPDLIPNVVHTKMAQCYICKVVFPSVAARNSHMRVHKNGDKRPLDQRDSPPSSNKRLKQQHSYEPIVEIHEGTGSQKKMPSSIGSVSITPVATNNKNSKQPINSAIMKLVQNNPNITLKPRESTSSSSTHTTAAAAASKAAATNANTASVNSEPSQTFDGLKSFKCSSCSKQFANKSNLYFHKKNQCNGSRYPCPFCKKRFGKESEYSAHIFYDHPD